MHRPKNTHGLKTICRILTTGLAPSNEIDPEAHHALLQHQLRGRVGQHREQDERQIFHVFSLSLHRS